MILGALAVVVIVWRLLALVIPSKLGPFNIEVVTFAILTAVMAAFLGAPLLAGYLLYPEALNFAGLADLLAFLVLTAALSALVLEAEATAVKVLSWLGVDRSWGGAVFTFVYGLATALLMILISRFFPGVEVVNGAALAVGLIGAFGFYFVERAFVNWGSSDTERMSFAGSTFEDKEDD